MTLKLKKYKEIYVIDLEGELDLYNAYKLKTLYQKMTEKGIQSIVINLENLDYLDSSGLGSLIYLYLDAKNNNRNLILCNLGSTPKKLIEMTRLENFFSIEKTVEDCIEKLQ
jgi:anti-sigma B factor antagonist